MVPSKYQQAIIDWALNGTGNATCRAVAGAGKSSTLKMVGMALVESGKYREEEIRLLVFGNQNAKDLSQKFPRSWTNSISTINACGWRILRNHLGIVNPRSAKIDSWKYQTITRNHNIPLHKILEKSKDFKRLLDLVRLTKTDYTKPDQVAQLCRDYNINLKAGEMLEELTYHLSQVVTTGIKSAQRENLFDFVDQIFLPIYWDKLHQKEPDRYQPVDFPQFPFVMVDECQDLSPLQLDLVKRIGKRLLFVGDPYQAIMGFAGADSNSYHNILHQTKAQEFPLSICYRCPTTHIEAVKLVTKVKEIEGIKPTTDTAQIKIVHPKNLKQEIQLNDVIIARRTAPLVQLCISLICQDIHAVVKGKDIGESLKEEIKLVTSLNGYYWQAFLRYLEIYYRVKCDKYLDLDNGEEMIEELADKISAIRSIYLAKPFEDEKAMLDYLDSLFTEDTNAKVTLYTVHRCKGMENHRVMIIEPEKMPLMWKNQKDWQLEQEENLLYVALTRATQELIISHDPRNPAPWVQSIQDKIVAKHEKSNQLKKKELCLEP